MDVPFVRDVRPQVSKLDHKSLNVSFLVIPGFRRVIGVSALVFVGTWFLRMSSFLRICHTSQGVADDLLVYTIASPVAPPVPAPVKPLITQVYTRRQNPLVSGPPLAALTSDPVPDDDLPIALRKGRRQCVHPISHFAPITSCLLSPVLLLLFWTLFRWLTLFRKPCLTLVGVVL